ncbi:hypothetical protein B7P43_G05713, partial [Cryptotermes secundus]
VHLALSVVPYGCETWSLILREEHRLRVFENRVLRRIFEPKRDEGVPRSPDITPCYFFLWGYVKDRVFVPPLMSNVDDLKNRITAVVASVEEDTLRGVLDEFSYGLNVRAAGKHIEHLKKKKVNKT